MTWKTDVDRIKVSLPEVVGRGYGTFWNTHQTYVVCKGSRASKKSKTAALWLIWALMSYPQANALVVRKVERTLRDSCYADLKWAIHRLQVDAWWTCTTSPLEMTYRDGQKIIFRGMDDPLKLASISVPQGVLNFLWIEEAYEIMDEASFDMLDESIRGQLPDGYFKRVMITFNPWNERHWIKKRFFDTPADNVLAMTTNYTINEWLSDTDRQLFENMKQRNPRRYQVAGLGNWGVVEGLVYENWKEEAFTLQDIRHCRTVCGLDFGYTNDPSAFVIGFLDKEHMKLYIWDEIYQTGMSNRAIFNAIVNAGYGKERVTADSAEPKSIDELKGMGLHVKGAKKGKDSIMNGIQWVQDLEIIVHPRCNNFLTEISNYSWKEDKFGKKLNEPIDEFNHLMDAMRYALEDYIIKSKWVM